MEISTIPRKLFAQSMIKDFSLDGMVGKQLDFFIDSILGIPHRTSIFTVILNASNNIVERGKVPGAKTQAAIYRISLISMETDVSFWSLGMAPSSNATPGPNL